METDCGQWKTKGKAHEKRSVWSHSTHIRYEQHATTLVLEKNKKPPEKHVGDACTEAFIPARCRKAASSSTENRLLYERRC